MEQNKSAIIIGAGLVGSLWAVYLSRAGYKVTIYERRSDIRKAEISAGKSINLSLSTRGWKALDTVGVGDEIREIAIPMFGRTMHDVEGNLTYQPYGKEGEAIYSVSRGGVNARMMDIAEKFGKEREAVSRSGQEPKDKDLVMRSGDRKTSDKGYRTQAVVKQVVEGIDEVFGEMFNAKI